MNHNNQMNIPDDEALMDAEQAAAAASIGGRGGNNNSSKYRLVLLLVKWKSKFKMRGLLKLRTIQWTLKYKSVSASVSKSVHWRPIDWASLKSCMSSVLTVASSSGKP